MTEPTKEELLFGRIALHNKIMSEDQYKELLALRMRSASLDFGALALAQGIVNEKQFQSIRKAQEKHIVKNNNVSDEEAAEIAKGPTGGAPAPSAPAPAPAVRAHSPAAAESAESAPAAPRSADGNHRLPEGVELVQRPGDERARKMMCAYLSKAREAGASDVHLNCGAIPFMRLHGAITPFPNTPVLDNETSKKLLSSVLTDRDWSLFMHNNDWDGGVDLGPLGRYRTNVLLQRRGISGVFRIIKDKVPNLVELGLPDTLESFTTFHQGLVLVTGATGSGKSSTLAALIDLINMNRKDHIITLEDPIEYIYQSKSCNVTQRQIDLHTKSWGNALRAALREDPDVILIGEMRDLDTVRLAITAAETGHLVLGTLHTTNATRTIDRVLDVFPPKEQAQIRAMVSESLKGIISQQLVPRADGKGRVCAYELLFTTPAVSHLIREKRTFQLFSVMQTGRKQGMKLMDDSLRELLNDKVITLDVARMCATNPRLFQK